MKCFSSGCYEIRMTAEPGNDRGDTPHALILSTQTWTDVVAASGGKDMRACMQTWAPAFAGATI
jgi:hypothetical protein